MADRSKIEWTEATWNPVTGCEEVSPGCDHCYAKTFAERWRGTPGHPYANGFDLTLRPERLDQPLRWTRPRRVFVNSMSDLFHKDVPDEYIAKVFAVMSQTPQHTYQVLTKRHGRMRSLLRSPAFLELTQQAVDTLYDDPDDQIIGDGWPLQNVWLGVSVEDQPRADLRIPALLETPAAVRWLSCEPLIGFVGFTKFLHHRPIGENLAYRPLPPIGARACDLPSIDWVVAGGESGPGARAMHPAWARDLRDQCAHAEIPFFFKQHGAWVPESAWLHRDSAPAAFLDVVGNFRLLVNGKPVAPPMARGNAITMRQVGKKAAGRVLDGRAWDEYPGEVRHDA